MLGTSETVPIPVPAVVTVSGSKFEANDAVTDLAASIVIVQVRVVPLHAPPQPVNTEPLSGDAVSVTPAPTLVVAVQDAPQAMPTPVTLPLPVPALLTVSPKAVAVKFAVTVLAASMVTVQVDAVPLHAPVQPANSELLSAATDSVTLAPTK